MSVKEQTPSVYKMSDYQRYIAMSRYARFIPEEQRRETWEETVARYCDFFSERFPASFPRNEAYEAIVTMENMPSMRALMTAGAALDRDEVAGYNCSYIAVDNPRAFDEAMYVLMCGTGLGFSVEQAAIRLLPEVAEDFYITGTTIEVADSRIGWATSLRQLISLLYAGQIPKWDLSKLRPAGAPLKTFGGRSSGPEPLNDCFEFAVKLFQSAKGRRLTSLECHSMMCAVASAVVVGGVRRSALISLSDINDDRMRTAKSGQWWVIHPELALANNSATYNEKPDMNTFIKEWVSLYESKSGERGIFNRYGALKKMEGTRRDVALMRKLLLGCNPCAEIFLRPSGFCNLSTSVARPEDTLEDLKRKVRMATILGTYQSTLTNFRYLRQVWKKNAEEERLLGVSFVGIMDHPVLSGQEGIAKMREWLRELKAVAIETNKEWAATLGITQSVAITCVKPEGTVSQLVDASSGIHARYSQYYIRTVRNDKMDPLGVFLKEQGVPAEDDVMKPEKTWVFSFPQKSPDHAVLAPDLTAIEQLEHYRAWYEEWAEHTVSITVYVREHEWMEVGAWVYKNFDEVGGISFLPYSDHSYRQAPYQPISHDEYNLSVMDMPKIDWTKFDVNEHEDKTEGAQQYSCSAGVCELI
jgi:ribonucleoside-diphosphate reductase alpha chain